MTAQKAKKVEPLEDLDTHNARAKAEIDLDNEPEESTASILTTAEVAEALGTDARTLRKFLRSKTSGVTPVGQGKRYALSSDAVPSLSKKFSAWHERDVARRAKKDAETTQDDTEDTEAEVEIEDVEEFEVLSYSAEELHEMTVAELRDVAASLDVEVPSKAKKAELVDLLAD